MHHTTILHCMLLAPSIRATMRLPSMIKEQHNCKILKTGYTKSLRLQHFNCLVQHIHMPTT